MALSQLKLTTEEREELRQKILDDWTRDSSDLRQRAERQVRWIRLWRSASEELDKDEGSNFHIPLVLWQILNFVAKLISTLFGQDSEILVLPRGKTDIKRVNKVKRWMNYRIKESLHLFKKYYDFAVLKCIFGSAIAFTPWTRKTRLVKKTVKREVEEIVDGVDPVTGFPARIPQRRTVEEEQEVEVVDFEGLDFRPENNEDWVVPASATSLDDADHFIRRIQLSVPEILEMRESGDFDASLWKTNKEFTDELYRLAKTGKTDAAGGTDTGQAVRQERADQASTPIHPLGEENNLVFYNWFGKFRVGKDELPTDVVAFVSPQMNRLFGVVRRIDKYPDGRLPFIKTDLLRDPNKMWGIGFPEVLESINREMDALHNIVTDAGMIGVGPMVAYKPMAGFNAEKFRYEPWTAIPLNDPKNDIALVGPGQINIASYATLMPQLLAMAERIFGLTETQLGRQFSGPNAPRTYGQQALLQAESNQRLLLDLMLEREAFKEVLSRVWEADKRWLSKPHFFRVTEEDPGDVLTDEDMQGDYDFDITPPTALANKQQMIQDLLQAYALTLQNPIAMQNPALISEMLRKVLESLGQDDIAMHVPDASQLRPPESPEQENVRLIQGEDVDPHPQDNHVRHIAVHQNTRDELARMLEAVPQMSQLIGGVGVLARFDSHIQEHAAAQRQQGGPRAPMQFGGGGMGRPQLAGGGQGLDVGGPSPNQGQDLLSGILNQGGLNIG
jgi:hypothetical protein